MRLERTEVASEADKVRRVQWDCMKKLQIVYNGCKSIHSQVTAIYSR